jgi:hypothetical protein
MMTLTMNGCLAKGHWARKRRTVITLSHSNQPAPMQLFAAGLMRGEDGVIFPGVAFMFDVLDLFLDRAMF